MKNTLNLLPDTLKPKLEILTIYTVFICMAFSFVIMFGVSSFMDHDKRQIAMELDTLRGEINRKTSVLNVINAELENRTEDPVLIQTTVMQEAELKQKKRLVAELQARDTLLTHNFADLLEALAEKHSTDLWLTSIKVMGGDMLFTGHADEPGALPQWVSKLSETDYFNGREFSRAKLLRKNDQLVFELQASQGGSTNE